MHWRLLKIGNAITPDWLGIQEGEYSSSFLYRVRRLYVHMMDAMDHNQQFEIKKEFVEYAGMFSNPELYKAIKNEREKEVHHNPNWLKQLNEIERDLNKKEPIITL